jgi:hypothetical protein
MALTKYGPTPEWARTTPTTSVAALIRYNHDRRTRSTTPIPLRRKRDPQHGTASGYQRGCGCRPCTEAARHAMQQRRARRAEEDRCGDN